MPMYPFECDACKSTCDVQWSIKDYDNLPVPEHCGQKMEQVPTIAGIKFTQTIGRWNGSYDHDYGKRATEDLTVPGKMEKLQKAGVLKDPFGDLAPQPLEPIDV